MSRPSTTSTPKISTQLPQKSAWARGPPQTSTSSAVTSTSASPTRSQSPALPPPQNATNSPAQTHSRRSSALGQKGVTIKDGINIPSRGNAGISKQNSVTFGSIDDNSATISSSPANVPPIKAEGVKSFGSVPAVNGGGKSLPSFGNQQAGPSSLKQSSSTSNPPPPTIISPTATRPVAPSLSKSESSTSRPDAPAPSSTPTPKPTKVDIRKLFQNPPSSPSVTPQTNSDPSSPALSASLSTSVSSATPSTSNTTAQSGPPPPSQNLQNNVSTFNPRAGFQQTPSNGPPTQASRSPAFPRQTNLANGTSGGVGVGNRPPPTSNTPTTSGIQPGMSSPRLSAPPHSAHPGPPPPGGFPPPAHYGYYYPYMPQDPAYMYPPPWMQQIPPPPHPGQGTPGPHPAPIPLSPRNPSNQLHPGTPSPVPPGPLPPPSPSHVHAHPSPNNVSSPPPTPSTTTAPPGPGGGGGTGTSRLNTSANAFYPKKVTIKNLDGREVDFGTWRRKDAPASPVVENNTPPIHQTHHKRTSVIRMETVEAKEKRLAEEKEKEERARKAEEEKKAAEEEKKRKEEEERKKAEEEEKRKKEEAERKKEEEEEAERERIRKEEEKERVRKEEEAKKAAEEERKRKEKEEEERKAAEAEKLRLAREAEERRVKEEEKRVAAKLAEEQKPEEGEIVESPTSEEPPKEVREIFSRKEGLKIDTSITKTRPNPLDLSGVTKNVVAAPLSALATARIIEDLGHISYPEGVTSPKPELNVNSKKGKFRYDREFLLQFMAVCTEKPDVPLDVIGLEAVGDQPHYPMTRGGSGRHRTTSAAMPPPMSRQASMSGFKSNAPGGFTMGNFSTPTSKMTSEERFAMSQRSTSSTVTGSGMPFGRPGPMTRTTSQGGPGSNRTRSKRGGERNESNKVHAANVFNNQATKDQGANFEPVAPLEFSANRWTRKSPADEEQNVERKVKALLNKLTMEKFDSISDQIIEWANKSEAEKDGRTLIHVIRLVFEKATDEAAWSEMYARLCRKMMETISPNVQDDGIRNTDGKPITGGQLFRKYLLNRCQEDFERGWAAKDAAASAAAAKASEDAAVKKAAEASGEVELYSSEYYVAQKAKRQGLGLIQFIGELYKLQMLTERIMHECIKKLLGNVDNPEEEEIESLCRLLTTVGRLLDNPKARAHMDIYFTRMKELGKSNNVAPRMQFMLQDLIELRERKWIPRNQIAAPTTIAQVHEEAAKQRALAEKEAANRTLTMSRGGSRRGGDRGGGPAGEQQADGWSVAGGSTPRPPSKAGDLSNFGKINKSGPVVMGPSSVWAGKKDAAKRDSTLTRVNSSSNMFMMLGRDGEAMPETGSKPSRPSSRRTSVDLGVGGTPEPQRKKLQLLPRSKPVEEENKASGGSADHSEDEGGDEVPQAMSEAEANKKIAEDIKEFFSIRNIDESEEYFTKLPLEHHHLLVDKMISKAIESKEADGNLVANAFARAAEKSLCPISAFEEGFLPIAELLDDIAIDAPKAFQIMATMMKGAGLDKDEERRTRIALKSMDSDKLLELLA